VEVDVGVGVGVPTVQSLFNEQFEPKVTTEPATGTTGPKIP